MPSKFDLLTAGTDIKIEKISQCIYCGDDFALYDIEKKLLDTHGFNNTPQCSTCSFRMLSLQINDRHLYKKQDIQGNTDISIYSPESHLKTLSHDDYEQQVSDDIGLQYGVNISENVFTQFQNICQKFPRKERLTYTGLENCDYSSHIAYTKNAYLSFCVFTGCENIFFSFNVVGGCHNIFSSYSVSQSQNIFSSRNIGSSSHISFSQNIYQSTSILFSQDMEGCQECIFCCNQVNQKYMVFNKSYSKEEYAQIKIDILLRLQDPEQYNMLQDKHSQFLKNTYIDSSLRGTNNEKVVGDSVSGSSNSIGLFVCEDMKDSCNILSAGGEGKTSVDVFNTSEFGGGVQGVIGSTGVGYSVSNIFFSTVIVEGCSDIYYSRDLQNCQECMFSIGLRNKKYCILNTQYEKKEYFEKKEQLIQQLKDQGKWGHYPWFDTNMQDHPYNDTLAYDYFKVHTVIYPDGREEIIDEDARGTVTIENNDFLSPAILDLGGKQPVTITWRTREKEINIPKNMQTLLASELPTTQDAGDDILQKAIVCERTGRPYRIIKEEIEFCKKHSLPLPRTHHQVRIDDLLATRPIGQMYMGKSDISGDDILTVYKNKPDWTVCSPEEYREKMYG